MKPISSPPPSSFATTPRFAFSRPISLHSPRRCNSVSFALRIAAADSAPSPVPAAASSIQEARGFRVEVGSPSLRSPPVKQLSLSDKASFLVAFIACTTSVAFVSLVAATIPMLLAMGRAAISLSKLADTARDELPSTMAAVRLSGMEISDLTLELSDLSQEITDGVSKSTQAVQAAEAGIRQIGLVARNQTISMIQERASLPIITLQPVVVGAAKKTSRAVGRATKSLMNMISGYESSADAEEVAGES